MAKTQVFKMDELWTKVEDVNSRNLMEIRISASRGIAGYARSNCDY
ncbi:hypothetical protein [Dolichospermum compactum]|uniref:GAF/PAS/PAC sensor-containing adenylate/guanylate cyclase n=1 Tax=Dolichospermum compactum NIES-806 TaxID=1973481 RepID=A0A1Z4V8P5_9CYAN|nr:hypothetical protein [Dolichospermum compactum]BAZ87808.1 GAF/PAS/PAC sensor-containing adenylate/guanylate cyclase [Dolichospermum compactum NIES-806]